MDKSICVGEDCKLGHAPLPNKNQGFGMNNRYNTTYRSSMSRLEVDEYSPYEKGGAPRELLKTFSKDDSPTFHASLTNRQTNQNSALSR